MATEQAYHSSVQRTLSRFVTDWGGVCGLDVSTETVTDDETDQESLVVTVTEGLALDRCGRLIVVDDEQRMSEPVPMTDESGETTDQVAVYVEYDECYTDPVPAAKMENACEEECRDNRIVEDAEVTLVPGDPGDYHKSIAEIEFPDPAEMGATERLVGQEIDVVGDLEAEVEEEDRPEQGTIDVVVTDSAPPETVVVDISPPQTGDPDTLVGSLQVPPDTVVSEDGFSLPDGDFEVTGRIGEGPEASRLSGDLTFEATGDSLTAEGEFTYAEENGGIDFSVEASIDVAGEDISFDGSLEAEEDDESIRIEATGDISVSDADDRYLVVGEAELTWFQDGEQTNSATVQTIPWTDEAGEEVEGLAVDKPVEAETPPDEDIDLDAVLSGLARSYYRNEPRESCGGVDDDAILVGTITAQTDDWSRTGFERGPLVYTNDMLFDILARHVADFDNPHDVSVGVGPNDGADATVGVAESDGVRPDVGLTSTDGSVTITPDRRNDRIDLAAESGGLSGEFEEYYVFEKSLWTKVDAYMEIVREAPKYVVPQRVRILASRIVETSLEGLRDEVYETPSSYVEFLLDFELQTREQQVFDIIDRVVSDSTPEVQVADRALDRLEELVAAADEGTPDPDAIAIAEDRVAESARHLLMHAPTGDIVVEPGNVAYVGRDTVPDVRGMTAENAIRELWGEGWVYEIEEVERNINFSTATMRTNWVNTVSSQDPAPDTIADKPETVTIQVVAPPDTRRIDGIGPRYAEDLSAAGIDTLAELSLVSPEAMRVLTGVSRERATSWRDTSTGYTSAYKLTRYAGIGPGEAEALYEARRWTDPTSLTDIDHADLVESLTDEVGEGVLNDKFRDRIEEMDWSTVTDSIETLDPIDDLDDFDSFDDIDR